MNEPVRDGRGQLVEVHKARSQTEGVLLVSYLRDNGIEAAFQGDPNVSFDMKELLQTSDETMGVFVNADDAARAKELSVEFSTAVTDESVLVETAAKKLQVNQETIHRLRAELKEERRTFEFLGWIGVVFLGAAALLWAIWPAWLKMEVPALPLRLAMVFLLTLGAVFAGSWTSKRL
ncbi:MAG: hypothetical protein PCFJNLEI_00929 [Verrucomicrobiae bacterium]|nr:hypothetical protein [Verrucomicrobiae bacterium]